MLHFLIKLSSYYYILSLYVLLLVCDHGRYRMIAAKFKYAYFISYTYVINEYKIYTNGCTLFENYNQYTTHSTTQNPNSPSYRLYIYIYYYIIYKRIDTLGAFGLTFNTRSYSIRSIYERDTPFILLLLLLIIIFFSFVNRKLSPALEPTHGGGGDLYRECDERGFQKHTRTAVIHGPIISQNIYNR
jgi:hypothetical protein